MNQAKLYFNHNIQTRIDSQYFLNEYIHMMTWNSKGEDVVMDIGCGPGDVTTKVLLPMMPNNLKKLVAVDVSDNMIEFARNNFEAPKVEYRLADISSKHLPLDWYGSFDHLFSLFCLHWVPDQRQTIKNMYDILKPGGDMFLLYVPDYPLFEVFERMEKSPKWGEYLLETQKHLKAHKQWSSVESVKNLLNEVGFSTRVCKRLDQDHIHENISVAKQFLKSLNPFVATSIPKDLQDDYMNDVMNEMQPFISVQDCNERAIIRRKVTIVVASKPH